MMRWTALFAAVVVVWAIALPVAAVVRGSASTSRGAEDVARLTYLAGAVVCHQRPERSFRLADVPLPVCARCTGIYGGAAVAALGLVISAAGRARPRALPRSSLRIAALIALAPTVATIVYEWTTGHMPSHLIRAAAGVPIGAFVAWTVMRQTRAGGHSE